MTSQVELDKKREAIREVYPNLKVDKMKEAQVIAIYMKLKDKGKLRQP